MPEPADDLARVAAEVVAAVEALLRAERPASLVLHVSPTMRRVAIVAPDRDVVTVQLDKAA